jgi:hypothetical protein
MSPTGALVVALIALVLLGSLAAWLVNVPVWAIGIFAVLGGLLARRVFRRLSRGRARQNTEAAPNTSPTTALAVTSVIEASAPSQRR